MRKLALLLIGYSQLLSAVCFASDTTIGRYQLVNAEYVSISNGNGVPSKDLFLIDTSTGRTLKYASILSNGVYKEGWVEVGSYNK